MVRRAVDQAVRGKVAVARHVVPMAVLAVAGAVDRPSRGRDRSPGGGPSVRLCEARPRDPVPTAGNDARVPEGVRPLVPLLRSIRRLQKG